MTSPHPALAATHLTTVLARLAGPDAVPRCDEVDAVAAIVRSAHARSGQ